MSRRPSFERLLLTGGTGFIGRHVLKQLIGAGHRPTAITRQMSHVVSLPVDVRDKVRWIELDLLDDEALREVIERERPSIIFHLAGTRGFDSDERNPGSTCSALNVDATLCLLRIANLAGVERIVIMGSAEEYGKQEGPFKETAVLQPVSAYGISKAEATRLALGLYASENCPVVIARLFTVYGPHQSRSMFISDAVNAAVRGEPFAMSEGIQQRDLVFVNDIVTAIIACAREPEIEGRIINFGSGNPVRLRDLVEMIWRISRSSAPLMVGKRVRRNDDMDVTWADSSLAEELLSWRSSTDLETGLTATVEWARASKEFSSGAAIL